MSDVNKRPYFVPEIKLDSMITLVVTLVGIGIVYGTLKGGIDQNAKDVDKVLRATEQKADKEAVGKGEIELSRRITEQQADFNRTSIRIDEGFREVKGLLRDLDAKLDHKADKPGR